MTSIKILADCLRYYLSPGFRKDLKNLADYGDGGTSGHVTSYHITRSLDNARLTADPGNRLNFIALTCCINAIEFQLEETGRRARNDDPLFSYCRLAKLPYFHTTLLGGVESTSRLVEETGLLDGLSPEEKTELSMLLDSLQHAWMCDFEAFCRERLAAGDVPMHDGLMTALPDMEIMREGFFADLGEVRLRLR